MTIYVVDYKGQWIGGTPSRYRDGAEMAMHLHAAKTGNDIADYTIRTVTR